MTISKQFGDLVLAFTDRFEFRWNDQGSGGDNDGGFWHPIPPDGFYVLGSIGLSNYSNPNYNPQNENATKAALCVRAASVTSGPPPLKPPIDYELIWKDSGSGGDNDGSCWRPKPPAGYVALGDVFQRGYGKPTDASKVMCVREDLTYDAKAGKFIWNDEGTGADRRFGSWEIANIPGYKGDPGVASIAPNCFVGWNQYDQPQTDPVLHVLYLPLPFETPNQTPPQPELTSGDEPPQYSPDSQGVVDYLVFVPFTGITDTDNSWTVHRQVEESPFYKLQRLTSWFRVLWQSNATDRPSQAGPVTYTVGVQREQSSSYSEETSVAVSEEEGVTVGVSAEGVSAGVEMKTSATVTTTLGWESATANGEMASVSFTYEQEVKPKHSLAEWAKRYTVQLVRQDDRLVPVTKPMTFLSAIVSAVSQWPPPTAARKTA